MRFVLVSALLLGGSAVPALAQNGNVERRVGKLESEMRAVQRKVFPNGPQALLAPEIAPPQESVAAGIPASSAVADLTSRVDALERQLASLTGQIEEGENRIRKLEDSLAALRTQVESRPTEPESEVLTAAPDASGTQTEEATDPAPAPEPPNSGDPAEDAYIAGYRLWEAGSHAEAAKTLEAMAKKWPKHRRASYAQNLAGRAYLDDGKPATAAKVLLANYQTNPKGERAADSLYFLGQALTSLKKPAEACKVYDELEDVYAGTIRDWIAQRLPKARTDAKCG